MTSAQVQLLGQRQATAALIRSEPTLVALVRGGEWVRTASGGQKRSGASETLTAVNRFFSTVDLNDRHQYEMEGEVVFSDHVLVGLADDDMQRRDEFVVGNRRFQIIFVHPDRRYECRAEVREVSNA